MTIPVAIATAIATIDAVSTAHTFTTSPAITIIISAVIIAAIPIVVVAILIARIFALISGEDFDRHGWRESDAASAAVSAICICIWTDA